MIDKTSIILGYITLWQTKAQEDIEDDKIAIYNALGSIVNLVGSGLLSIRKLKTFINLLSLSAEEKEEVNTVIYEAYSYYSNVIKEYKESGDIDGSSKEK